MNFMGYPRKDGSIGARNYVGVISTAACASDTATSIAKQIPGCMTFTHHQACGLVKPDRDMVHRTLINLGKHANLASVLVVGPECADSDVDLIANGISESKKRVEVVKIHALGGIMATVAKGIQLAREMVEEASAMQREECNVSHLRLGVECGGSTPLSGSVTNAAMGAALDIIIGKGGGGGFSETTEVIGAEHIIARRAQSKEVERRMIDVVERFEKRLIASGLDFLGSNPDKQNVADGLSSIEEKALGAIAKGGTTPLMEVCDYGEIPKSKGLFFIDTPGSDYQSLTGLAAAGCQVITYSTEGACPPAFPFVPTIKITANARHCRMFQDIIDFLVDIDAAFSDIKAVGQTLYERILEVASGRMTKSETTGYGQFNDIFLLVPTS
jgi:altronate dehydratase large subunit